MKRMGYVFLAEAVLAGMLVTLAGGQTESLGDYARSVRKDEKPASAKKYDNDNLPKSDKISVVGNATESSPEDANRGFNPADSSAQAKDGDHAFHARRRRMPANPRTAPTRTKRTKNGNRRFPSSRPRWTCSRVKWT